MRQCAVADPAEPAPIPPHAEREDADAHRSGLRARHLGRGDPAPAGGAVLVKRIKTIRNPAVFKARVRLTGARSPACADTRKKGYGSWVTTCWPCARGSRSTSPMSCPRRSLERTRTAAPDEARALRLGDQPVIATLVLTTGATIELAMGADKVAAGLQPYAGKAAQAPPTVAAPAEAGPPQPASAAGGRSPNADAAARWLLRLQSRRRPSRNPCRHARETSVICVRATVRTVWPGRHRSYPKGNMYCRHHSRGVAP